ncbi:hypothetical protein HDV06_006586 [Boothiomyces sp. JEL0866]|nr:hypothetical protein HDV06_006586 [Boothiomyces sp. JEL0866]
MFKNLVLLFAIVCAQNQINVLWDDNTGGTSGIFTAGSTLVPNSFNNSMNFQFTSGGILAINFKNTDQVLSIGMKRIIDPNSVPGSPPQLHLTETGLLNLEAAGLPTVPMFNATSLNVLENGRFFMVLEYDFRVRIRDQNNPDDIIWEYPAPRSTIPNLDAKEKNWISTGECLTSPQKKYQLCLNNQGQLISNTGYVFNDPINFVEPRVLVFHNDATFGLYNYKGESITLSGTISSSGGKATPGGSYRAYVQDDGTFVIRDAASQVIWSVDITNSDFIYNYEKNACIFTDGYYIKQGVCETNDLYQWYQSPDNKFHSKLYPNFCITGHDYNKNLTLGLCDSATPYIRSNSGYADQGDSIMCWDDDNAVHNPNANQIGFIKYWYCDKSNMNQAYGRDSKWIINNAGALTYYKLQWKQSYFSITYDGFAQLSPQSNNQAFAPYNNKLVFNLAPHLCLSYKLNQDRQFLFLEACDVAKNAQIIGNTVTFGTECLDVTAGDATKNLQLYSCGPGNPNQSWTITPK